MLEKLGRSGSGVMRVGPRDLTLPVATSCWFVRNERGMTSQQRVTATTTPRSNPEAYTTELSRNILRFIQSLMMHFVFLLFTTSKSADESDGIQPNGRTPR